MDECAHRLGGGGTLRLAHPVLASLTRRGVRVAIIDSGVHVAHPHVGGVAGGTAIDSGLVEHDDYVDRLGHGTAVAAAIREKAPGAGLFCVKLFDRELATRADVLVRAIDWAVEREVLLVNLSLWTTNRDHEQDLSEAVERARVAGTTIVTAHRDGPDRWLPGSLPGVVAVDLDWTCGRDEIRLQSLDADGACLSLSGYPRPIPGVSAERNLRGVSFAVANAAGFLARACESGTGGSPVQSLLALLERTR